MFQCHEKYVLFNAYRHLARNPFICDCNLRWLADYLHKNPIETSGARCDAPKRMHRRRIEALRDEKFKCKYFNVYLIQVTAEHSNTSSQFVHSQIEYVQIFYLCLTTG